MIGRLLLLLGCLSVLDGALTVAEVSSGIATEANPLMAPFVGSLPALLSAKVLPIAALSALTAFAGHVPLRAVHMLCGVYSAVLVYHLWGLSL